MTSLDIGTVLSVLRGNTKADPVIRGNDFKTSRAATVAGNGSRFFPLNFGSAIVSSVKSTSDRLEHFSI
jgi:hypothetical protein